MSNTSFLSEQTQRIIVQHQGALTRQFKIEAEVLRRRNLKDAENRQKAQSLKNAIDVYRRLLASPKPKDRRRGRAAKDVCDALAVGGKPSDEQVRRAADLFN